MTGREHVQHHADTVRELGLVTLTEFPRTCQARGSDSGYNCVSPPMPKKHSLLTMAQSGDIDAQCRLADKLMSAENKQGYAKALPWLLSAAEAGNYWAEYHLGLIYEEGLVGPRILHKAVYWYERSAAQGYESAQLNLGIILANRRGPGRDIPRAMALYRQAARAGRPAAAYNLGLYYHHGRGVKKNLSAARRWYGEAARLGDEDAKRILEELKGQE